ncbi:HEPN domain-containing protein [Terribacillus saccharophilus]|uniref:HEPN domain-containing protein n=1 Tax=Terribacillus saccharophilus TaxID=361277 RepID=UPI002989BDF0|nr:HEPN domain-containing protein [Terribacillus saccharophilus]MCM3226321.1 HEPN domain-containing protein [Terribacillus saccharophilus]
MDITETEPLLPTPNKINNKYQIAHNFFEDKLEDLFKVTYILITDEDKEGNIINKIINKVFEAIDITDYPAITNKNSFQLTYNSNVINIQINSQKSENNNVIWEVVFESSFLTLEDLRTKFLTTLIKDNRFKQKYCVQDEISDLITITSYPLVRELENILRDYLLRFFVKKFGYKWWDLSKTPQLEGKVSEKERTFSKMLDFHLYNLDFIDLTELLEGKSSVDNLDVINSLDYLSSNRDDLAKFERKVLKLKHQLIGNWQKFFEEHITVTDFIKTWKDLYLIRCEVAHNSFMNLTKFVRLVEHHKQIKQQILKLIDELRIVKAIEYDVLEKILNFNISLSKEDVNFIIDYNSVHLSPLNFGKDELSIHEFDSLISAIETELVVLGDFEMAEYQFNLDNEEMQPHKDYKLPSITREIHFSKLHDAAKIALELGLKNNKFI